MDFKIALLVICNPLSVGVVVIPGPGLAVLL